MSDIPADIPALRPCPFCKGRAEITREGTRKCSCIVECTNCGCFLESLEKGALSGTAWNTRPQEEAQWELLRETREFVNFAAQQKTPKVIQNEEYWDEFGPHKISRQVGGGKPTQLAEKAKETLARLNAALGEKS